MASEKAIGAAARRMCGLNCSAEDYRHEGLTSRDEYVDKFWMEYVDEAKEVLDAVAAVDGDAQWNAARDTCIIVIKALEDECETNRLSFVQTRNSESAQLALFERNILRRALAAIRSLKRLK